MTYGTGSEENRGRGGEQSSEVCYALGDQDEYEGLSGTTFRFLVWTTANPMRKGSGETKAGEV